MQHIEGKIPLADKIRYKKTGVTWKPLGDVEEESQKFIDENKAKHLCD